MKVGTLGFEGTRLREAREARGLAASALAELVSVSKQAISRYENGADSPHPTVMQRISNVLNLPTAFFLRAAEPDPGTVVFFRSMSAATKAARTRARRRQQWVQMIASFLEEFLEFPPAHFPDFPVPSNPHHITPEQIEQLALDLRRYWKLGNGPISNITWLCENHGAIVVRDELQSDALDALSTWVNGRPYVVLGADKASAVRSRFDLAHEVGHTILHRRIDPARLVHPTDFKLIEDQAHRFASALILPQPSYAQDVFLPTLESFLTLKAKWLASVGMQIKRVDDLHLASPEQVQQLWISYGRRKWRSHEPLDDELPIEEPRVLRHSIELALKAGVLTPADIRERLPLAATDIEDLTGLPYGTMGEGPPPVRVLSLSNRRTARQQRDVEQGELIDFPTERQRM